MCNIKYKVLMFDIIGYILRNITKRGDINAYKKEVLKLRLHNNKW